MTDAAVPEKEDNLLQDRLNEVGSVQRDDNDRDQYQSMDMLPELPG